MDETLAELKLPRERGESVEDDWLRKEEPTSTPTMTLRGAGPYLAVPSLARPSVAVPSVPPPSSSDVRICSVEEDGVLGGFRGA